ncbi:hypothetical protein D9757_015291 [Collybiopsis confluens]|uniref:Uncharacterized protein n=1 Tax=Collybiopsis confluens TaxID=2823264 RepID=A0A8H5CAR5_9AGAR|nr:hypothetical protein D9757_015291 [Collybiopsis confluens]
MESHDLSTNLFPFAAILQSITFFPLTGDRVHCLEEWIKSSVGALNVLDDAKRKCELELEQSRKAKRGRMASPPAGSQSPVQPTSPTSNRLRSPPPQQARGHTRKPHSRSPSGLENGDDHMRDPSPISLDDVGSGQGNEVEERRIRESGDNERRDEEERRDVGRDRDEGDDDDEDHAARLAAAFRARMQLDDSSVGDGRGLAGGDGRDEDEDAVASKIEEIEISDKFIRLIRDATLDNENLDPHVLARLRNPIEGPPDDLDPDA